jgi:hypothetical protein
MADKFEDVSKAEKNANVTFHVIDGEPISGIFQATDTAARTVTLISGGKSRVVTFPPDVPALRPATK